MSISPLYIPLFTIEEVILDKTSGLPLASGVVKFFRDSQRLQPKPVYLISGGSPNYTFVSLGTELTLGVNGAFVDEDGDPIVPYAYPYDAAGNEDLYYITVEDSEGNPQFTREAVPYLGTGATPPSERSNTENELTNPQFVEVLIPTGSVVLSVSGSNTVTHVAPGWDIVTSGTGTLTLERLQPTASGIPTNPPYALSITASSGLGASITLRQRLLNSPTLLRGAFASGSVTAAVLGGGASSISMTYLPTSGLGSPIEIIAPTAITTDGAYHIISGNVSIDQFVNTSASTGYIDISLIIPTSRTIALTSIQLVGVSNSIDIPFDEQSADRQKDHLFHYYQNAILRQPKSDILAGWNFALNPWQFRSPTLANLAANEYTADQTIVVQQAYVASAINNNVQVGRTSHTSNYAFQVSAVTSTNKISLINYIDPQTIRPYWGEKLSVRLRGRLTTTNGTSLRFKVRLMYKAGLPVTISQTRPVNAWTAANDSIPDVATEGWTYITSVNDPTYTFTSSVQNFDFDGFVLPASTNANMTLAVVFIMMNPMVETGTPDHFTIERISLVHNDFAIDAPPETYEQALKKCEFYYEKSYDFGVLPGTASAFNGSILQDQMLFGSAPSNLRSRLFHINFKTPKRDNTFTMQIYSPGSGTADRVIASISRAGVPDPTPIDVIVSSNWTTSWGAPSSRIGNKSVTYLPTNVNNLHNLAGSNNSDEPYIEYHYTADARLGR